MAANGLQGTGTFARSKSLPQCEFELRSWCAWLPEFDESHVRSRGADHGTHGSGHIDSSVRNSVEIAEFMALDTTDGTWIESNVECDTGDFVSTYTDLLHSPRTRSTKHVETAAGMLHANANQCRSMGTSITKLVHPSISTVYASSKR